MNTIHRETLARYRVGTPDSKSGLMTYFLVSTEEPVPFTQQADTDIWRQRSFIFFLGRSDDSLNDSDCMSSNDSVE